MEIEINMEIKEKMTVIVDKRAKRCQADRKVRKGKRKIRSIRTNNKMEIE